MHGLLSLDVVTADRSVQKVGVGGQVLECLDSISDTTTDAIDLFVQALVSVPAAPVHVQGVKTKVQVK